MLAPFFLLNTDNSNPASLQRRSDARSMNRSPDNHVEGATVSMPHLLASSRAPNTLSFARRRALITCLGAVPNLLFLLTASYSHQSDTEGDFNAYENVNVAAQNQNIMQQMLAVAKTQWSK